MSRAARPVADRMAQHTQKGSGCWIWTGNINSAHGYGRLHVEGRNHLAHRLAYEFAKGPIPDGLVIDHTCHNADTSCRGGGSCMHRRCVNPDHLEAVLHRVNTLRGAGIPAIRARANACLHGHEYTPENTISQRGYRLCRTCRDRRAVEANERNRKRPPRDPNRCSHGHEWTEANTYRGPKGRRSCRTCHREDMRKRREAAA